MKFFRRKKASPSTEELIGRAKAIEPLVDKLCQDIVRAHRDALLAHEVTYVVPAVWGVSPQGPLNDEQKAIHAKVAQVVDQVMAIIDMRRAQPAQEYAVAYLLRGLIISKVAFQIEGLKYHLMCMNAPRGGPDMTQRDFETMGNA
ncbi:hypothetical protein Deba_2863 [Desulfarculus baarsii DSM 2075]|uniref:Uncharacterized protein n=1 Tax=Desulfarculus baarsii (strain ATCC 33931 / DSM 2075 / LMG 7858 / VKM B-1802 / 2st14) TaxID=644282 RepID=E1QMH3_DESB2|nr:hypothetical protein [Desulfarculus baarsii]ADK86216.1 hypothetical protein Deba_2863 [Desulfarculus baarsii DSM 2075]